MPTVSDIRSQFLDYFKSKGHLALPSSSLVPHNDPTLMFTNAGMNQFKNIFTGVEKPPATPRAATSQKCVRAGGKHNDLDNVGYTARHHTFFEMLGNFSFGDYFKEGAISHAWELITNVWGISPEKLCVTVYHTDDEAFNLWKKIAGLPESKIIRIPTNDNFWAMGDTGPCGPCSEIFYDHGDNIPGGPPGSKDADGDRFIEIWNLVFMQYEQVTPDKRIDLPKPSIDTGMGLERISAVLQGVHDNYDIDLFKTIIHASEELTKNTNAKQHNSHRVIADHLRASGFLIADGVLPSNEGRGYVLRRIMRRAMRHAHMLGTKDPLMHRLVPTLVQEMGTAFPELGRAQATIASTLQQEEERFRETLGRGLKLLEEERGKLAPSPGRSAPTLSLSEGEGRAASAARGEGVSMFPGDIAFKLYDTYGFPLDLTQDILRADNIQVDTKTFDAEMEAQRQRARAAHKGSGDTATSAIWFDIKDRVGATEFLGYAMEHAEGVITALVKDGKEVNELQAGEKGFAVTNQTPFYGESGGQVGDTGHISAKDILINVLDTIKPVDGLHAHAIEIKKGAIKVGTSVELHVDSERRSSIRSNHSATHLLHAALRKKLGEHVTQKGSLVSPEYLRFDITHPKQVTREELSEVEAAVNAQVTANTEATTRLMTPDEAIKAGAMALFGEKYGDEVRVLAMGIESPVASHQSLERKNSLETGDRRLETPFSVELCGGTHVKRTGDIGLFKITSEGSVSAGVRRIEATTGEGVRRYVGEQIQKLSEQLAALAKENARLAAELKKPAATVPALPSQDEIAKAKLADLNALYATAAAKAQQAIETIQDENKKLNKQLAEAKKQAAMGDSGEANVETVGAVKLASQQFAELDAKSLRDLANGLQQKHADAVSVLLSSSEGKANIIVAIGKDLQGKVNAPDLVKAGVEAVGGKGGGGRPEFAQGGGPDGGKLDAALSAIKQALAA